VIRRERDGGVKQGIKTTRRSREPVNQYKGWGTSGRKRVPLAASWTFGTKKIGVGPWFTRGAAAVRKRAAVTIKAGSRQGQSWPRLARGAPQCTTKQPIRGIRSRGRGRRQAGHFPKSAVNRRAPAGGELLCLPSGRYTDPELIVKNGWGNPDRDPSGGKRESDGNQSS